MEQFKRAQVILLETKELTSITKCINSKKLSYWGTKVNGTKVYHNNQHLYIISDDEIKEEDWVYQTITKSIIKAPFNCFNDERFKKIIATTDKSIRIEETINGIYGKNYLPQPSQQFIEKYIEEYNKGDIIKDVLVEYENIMCPKEPKCINCYSKCLIGFKLKINPKDNTITIKKLKESWNREEIFELLKKAYLQGRSDGHCTFRDDELGFDNWIKENL